MTSKHAWRRAGACLLLAVAALVGDAAGVPATAGADEAAWLYDPGAVARIDLTLSPEAIAALEADPDTYQSGQFAIDGTKGAFGPLTVGVRLKGSYSFRPLTGKAAFKIKFDKFVKKQRFQGLEKMTLNSMVQDPSMIHETLAYEAFRAAGVPAPRTGYAQVTVNGEEFGLYLDLESLDKISLPRWFASTRHLFEAGYSTDVTPGGAGAFEVDEGAGDDLADLEALIAAANADGGDWSEGMAGYADLEEMTRMWAVERYIGHWDGYSSGGTYQPNNYYLQSEDSGLFRIIPWGTDQTWASHLTFSAAPGGVMFRRCLEDTSCAAMYRDAVGDAAAAIDAAALDSRVTQIAALLAPFEDLEPPRELAEHSREEIDAEVDFTAAFIAGRRHEAAQWLASPEPEDPPDGNPSRQDPLGGGPDTGDGSPPSGSRAADPSALRVGDPRAAGRAIVTHIALPGPGTVTQHATSGVEGRARTVCAGRGSAAAAALLVLHCRLSDWAVHTLGERALPVRVRSCFASGDGALVCALDRLVVPIRGGANRKH